MPKGFNVADTKYFSGNSMFMYWEICSVIFFDYYNQFYGSLKFFSLMGAYGRYESSPYESRNVYINI